MYKDTNFTDDELQYLLKHPWRPVAIKIDVCPKCNGKTIADCGYWNLHAWKCLDCGLKEEDYYVQS